jgi:ATP-binding cassette subfamily B multidrug efflux pump
MGASTARSELTGIGGSQRMEPKRPVFKRLLNYALVYKFRIIGALLVLCCAVGAELGGPFIVKTIIDKHLTVMDHNLRAVFQLIGLYIALLLTASICNFVQSYTLQSTALRIIKNMRMHLMHHIQRVT